MAALSSDSIESIASNSKYERHKSAKIALGNKDTLMTCIDLDYSEQLENLLKTEGRHFSQEKLDKALLRAAATGKTVACQLLVKAGSDPNALESPGAHKKRYSLLNNSFVVEQGMQELWVKSHSSFCGSALHLSIEHDSAETFRALLDLGASVNTPDKNGLTPLMLACMQRGSANIVQVLVRMPGCDVMAKDYVRKRTALHYATEAGDAMSVQLLLDAGALVEERDLEGNTPLMLAFTSSPYELPTWPPRQTNQCCQLLLDHGCFVNAYNKNEMAPIDFAVSEKSTEGVEFLLQNNAVVSKNALREACLQVKDECIVGLILHKAHSFEDEFLCALLVLMISSSISKWSFNSREEEFVQHQIAKCVIRAISDPAVYANMTSQSGLQLLTSFEDDHSATVTRNDLSYIKSYGLLGYALLNGKYGIARMLYEAGCRDHMSRLSDNQQIQELACKHFYLKSWLPAALQNNKKKPTSGDSERNSDDVYIPGLDLDKAFDNVQPYDEALQQSGPNMLDQNYVSRENSRAFLATNVFIYS